MSHRFALMENSNLSSIFCLKRSPTRLILWQFLIIIKAYLQFLGKVDRNRYGESVYVVLENHCFEVRDGEGLIVAKHKSQDISVVTEIEGDANVFVYIGRCKFGGRIGMVLKFNKFRHIGIVIDFFKNGWDILGVFILNVLKKRQKLLIIIITKEFVSTKLS